MGFSTSGATVVLFVGLLVGVGVLYPTVESAGERVTDARSDRDDRALRQQNTAVELTVEDHATSYEYILKLDAIHELEHTA
jgi:archaellum component FlaF (FlaF/FlaG flagellin family)